MSVSLLLGLGVQRHTLAGRGLIFMQPRAGVVFQPGSAVVHRDGVQLGELPSARTDLISLGTFLGESTFTASSSADANGGALDAQGNPQVITVQPLSGAGTGWFSTGTGANQITAAMVDRPCFWFDDDTLYATDLGGTLSFAGYVEGLNPDGSGRVALKSDEQMRCLYELYSAGEAVLGSTQDMTARAVATNLAAGAFAAGVLTPTANGAIGAQDGVTLAVGDVIVLPAGTVGSLTVSAANAGPYEVAAVGAAGSKFSLARPAKWQHGALIAPSRVKLGGEGTLFHGSVWYADPATATKVVGTDDAVLYPERVTQQVALALSTATIANVPIKSASKSNVLCQLAAAGGVQTSTVAYGPIVAPTPGGIGTASLVVDAIASGMTKNGTADTSTVNVTIFN